MASQTNTVHRCSCGLVLLWLFLAAVTATVAGAGERLPAKTVEVVGAAALSESDPEALREKALQSALEKAVFEVAAETVGADIFSASAAAIRAALAADTQRYIQSYRVLQEGQADDTYEVTVQATVSAALIDEALRRADILRTAERLPTVLFLTSQQNLEDVAPRYWWSGTARDAELTAEDAMMAALRESGFDVIPRSTPGVRVAAAAQRFNPSPENREAVELGLRIGADVVVLGRSSASATAGIGAQGPRTFTATAALRALEVPSGDLLAQTEEDFVTVDTDDRAGGLKALAGVGEEAGRSLAALLRPAWLNRSGRSSVVRLEVAGTRALANFVRFRSALKRIEGIRNIRLERLAADQAVIAVDLTGNASDLAARLKAGSHPSFTVDIYEISGKLLKIRLVETGGSGGDM